MDNAQRWHNDSVLHLDAKVKELQTELRKTRGEVHALRVDRECLLKRLQEDAHRHSPFVLPEPHQVRCESYVLALRVGDMPLTIPSFNEPYDRPHHYRLHFRKEYSSHGTFWRVEPFCTEPSDGRR